MIYLFSGTPGSGKSLHVAEKLYYWNRQGRPCICNFEIALDKIPGSRQKDFHFVSNRDLNPDDLIAFAQEYHQKIGRIRESSILLVVDECQLVFNARDWNMRGRDRWLEFFTLHRHWGYDIILIAQFDRMIDRQIRSLIEYEYIHRKIKNMGWRGKLVSWFALGNLFIAVKVWYPMKMKVGQEMFRASKKYYQLYDTFMMLEKAEKPEKQPKKQNVIHIRDAAPAPADVFEIQAEDSGVASEGGETPEAAPEGPVSAV